MSGEEDEKEYELKDLIVQSLETNGLLSKIKAQIRSSVFLALDESDKKNQTNDDIQNLAVKKVLSAPEGRTAASLVREFLEKANLDFTLSVFDPELNSTVLLDKRDKLVSSLKIKETISNRELPLLIELLKGGVKEANKDFSPNLVEAFKSKFDTFDSNKKGVIDEDKLKSLFVETFPNFNRNVIEAYLNDELTKNDFLKAKKWFMQCQNTINETENNLTNKTTQNTKIKNDGNLNKSNDENMFFKKTSNLSSLGDLPPLNGTNNNNKKVFSNLAKDLDKKSKDDDDYEDDFTNGTTPRTQSDKRNLKTRSGILSDEEVDDNISYVEESSKIDEITNDRSISTIHGNNDADYIEDVSI